MDAKAGVRQGAGRDERVGKVMYECCCIDDPDFEPADIFEETAHKARKKYNCYECRSEINIGDIYQKTSMLFDGRWSNHKTCSRCSLVSSDYMKCGHHSGDLVGDFKECYGFDYRDGIPKDFNPCGNKK